MTACPAPFRSFDLAKSLVGAKNLADTVKLLSGQARIVERI